MVQLSIAETIAARHRHNIFQLSLLIAECCPVTKNDKACRKNDKACRTSLVEGGKISVGSVEPVTAADGTF